MTNKGFEAKNSGISKLDRELSDLRKSAKNTFPLEMMTWYGRMIDGDQLGPCEDYGVAFEGLPQLDVETYKAAPFSIRAAACFNDVWDYIGPQLSKAQAFELLKAFAIVSSELAFEANHA